MKLSEVPFEEIYVGQPVQSDGTGRKGVVFEKLTIDYDYRHEDNLVSIWWDNGKMSIDAWHFQTDKVTVLELLKD